MVGDAWTMKYERLWERLLDFLNGWSTASEVESGQMAVTVAKPDGSTIVVRIVMTPNEWDEMVSIAFGDFDLAAQEVRESILRLGSEGRFLVYDSYELVPSASEDLPMDPDEVRLTELARLHPEGIGSWVAWEGDGNIEGELPPSQR